MNQISRRHFLSRLGTAAGCFAASAAGLDFLPTFRPARAEGAVAFPQGVASGDPWESGVILWTRAVPREAAAEPVPLILQAARSETFDAVMAEASVFAQPEADYTVRVALDGLTADMWFYYRFLAPDGSVSRIGRSRTAPEPGATTPLHLAMVSCQNYEQGWYGAWARMIADDEATKPGSRIDAVLHLGDFIYETTPDLPDGMTPVRPLPPFPDGAGLPDGRICARTVADYRHLYKTYLADEALQAARARWPFICTWDDHEFTNDSWQSYATYPGAEGPAQRRKVAANRAWFEYIPARLEDPAHDFVDATVADTQGGAPDDGFLLANADNLAALDTLTIYRTLTWGATADILIADARSYRSPPPMDAELEKALGAPAPPVEVIRALDEGRTANGGNPPAIFETKDGGAVANPRKDAPAGTVLGAAQKAWFKQALKESTASWKLWANSIPAMPLRLNLSAIPFQGLPDVALGIDAWNGYPGELRELMAYVKDEGIGGVISCAGDYHMHGAALLTTDPDADAPVAAAVEVATAGVSSLSMFTSADHITRQPDDPFRPLVVAGSEDEIENFNLTLMGGVRSALAMNMTGSSTLSGWLEDEEANPFIRYLDTAASGYVLLDVTAGHFSAQIVSVANAHTAQGDSAPAEVVRRARLEAPLWDGGAAPQLDGPHFEGKPPFPFA